MDKKGIIIVFEGIDQSGKGTQSKLFVERLKADGYDVEYLHFHDISTPVGKELQLFFEGKREFNPIARQLLFAANRYEKNEDIGRHIKTKDFVVIDRYIPSGLAYGVANGINLEWMLNVESLLHQPDIVVLLDVGADVSKQRKAEEIRDVYEKDLSFLENVRYTYLELAKRFGWIIVDGRGNMEDVKNKIWETVKKQLKNKALS